MYTISYPSGKLRIDGVVIDQCDLLQPYKDYVAWLKEGNGPTVIEDVVKPTIQVTSWQLRMALNHLGLRDAVEEAVSKSTDRNIKDGWEYSPTFSSDHPLTLSMGAAVNQDEDAMYALFQLAESL